MTNEWSTRIATFDDIDSILDLITLSLGEGLVPRHRDFWEWKHLRNPFGASPVLIAESQGMIVGLRVLMRWTWRSGNVDVPAVRAVDTATHPNWRGKHIFTQLTLELRKDMKGQGVSFIYNTPNRSSLPGYLKMGWKEVTRIPLWVRPLKFFGPVRSLLFPTNPVQKSSEESYGTSDASDLLSHSGIGKFLDQSIFSDTRYHTVRSLSYLKWRYSSVPGFRYCAKWRFDAGAGAAVIYRRRKRKGLDELSVSELLHTPGDSGMMHGRQLLRELATETKADYIVAVASSDSSEATILKRSGFFPVWRLGPILTTCLLNEIPCLPAPGKWSNWRCTIGDLEIF